MVAKLVVIGEEESAVVAAELGMGVFEMIEEIILGLEWQIAIDASEYSTDLNQEALELRPSLFIAWTGHDGVFGIRFYGCDNVACRSLQQCYGRSGRFLSPRTVTDPEDSLSCHTETIATSRPIFPRLETLIINWGEQQPSSI